MEKRSTSQKEKAQSSLFDTFLQFAAEIDWLSGPGAPTIFVVYAHDSSEYGSARQDVVRCLISWLTQVQARVLSDQGPIDAQADVERKEAVGDILSNQFCIFPTHDDDKVGSDSVDRVVVCGSQVLKQYCQDPSSIKYMESIRQAFYDSEASLSPAIGHEGVAQYKRKIRHIVEASADQAYFHHVLTELALVGIRKQRAENKGHGIVPVSLDEQNMTYLDFLGHVDLHLKLRDETVASLHKLFFKLLQLLYPGSECQTLIKRMRESYDTAVGRFAKEDRLEKGQWQGIIQDELVKLRSSLTRHEGFMGRFLKAKRLETDVSIRETILGWLPSPDSMFALQAANIDERADQTSTWLLDIETYRSWKESRPSAGEGSRLWCHGSPGSGKTILASSIIQDLQKSSLGAVAYFFCRHTDQSTVVEMVLNLISQLTRQRPRVSPALQSTYMNKIKAGVTTALWSLSETILVLMEEVRLFERVFFIIDGVDERLGNRVGQDLISSLRATEANIVITSRHHEKIHSCLEPACEITISSSESDIITYLRSRFNRDVRRTFKCLAGELSGFEDAMIQVVNNRSSGIFLLARIHVDLCIDTITNYPSPKTFQDVLDDLKKLPEKLEDTYDEFISRMRQSGEWELARTVLVWVLGAKEPVTMAVVQDAISLQRNGDTLDDHLDISILISYCLGLVRLSPETEHIELIHPSAAEHFQSLNSFDGSKLLLGSSPSIAISCLRCLNLEDSRTSGSSLRKYAIRYWSHHSRDNYGEALVPSLLSEYLSQTEKVTETVLQTLPSDFVQRSQHPLPTRCDGAHAAAYYGVSRYLESIPDVEIRDSNGWTPLWWALFGHEDTAMETLLRNGAAVSTWSTLRMPMWIWMIGIPQKTALSIIGKTFSAGNELIPETYMISRTRRLSDPQDTDVLDAVHIGPKYFIPRELAFESKQVNNEFWRIATHSGIQRITKLLDKCSLNACDQDGNTIVMTATDRGYNQLVCDLLDQGADVAPRNKQGETAFSLSLSVSDKSLLVMDCTFNDGAFAVGGEIHLHPLTFLDPWSFNRCIHQDEDLALRLLPQDIDPFNDTWRANLAKAIILRYPRVVKALLDSGVGANTRYGGEHTPLSLACSPPAITEYLFINNEVHIDAQAQLGLAGVISDDVRDSPAEHMSVMPRSAPPFPENALAFEQIVHLLLAAGADMEEEFKGKTPLALACENKQLSVFRALLVAGADISRVGPDLIRKFVHYLSDDRDDSEVEYYVHDAYKFPYGYISYSSILLDHFPPCWKRDFQTHDHCRFLLQCSIPQPLYEYMGNSHIHSGQNCRQINAHHRRQSKNLRFVRESPVMMNGESWNSSDWRFALKSSKPASAGISKTEDLASDAVELLRMIERGDVSGGYSWHSQRRQVCLRNAFWSFGKPKWYWDSMGHCGKSEWCQYMSWKRLIRCCLFRLTPWNPLAVPIVWLRSPRTASNLKRLHFVGLIEHEDAFLRYHHPPHDPPITHNFLVQRRVLLIHSQAMQRERCAFTPFESEALEPLRTARGPARRRRHRSEEAYLPR